MFLEQFPEDGKYRGWIEVICGSMFSGKTEELIRRLRRINFAGQDLLLFKPRIDKRYSEECVVSHNGATFEAIQVDTAKEILNHWSSERIAAIDEAQFFDEDIVRVANHLASNGVRVICAGLDMDFQAKPFDPIPFLMASPDYLPKFHAF